ncbi:cytochrome C oxidase subunit IV family protein [Pseudomonas lopnurensis]|uniref:cytochrome C oxidase subunit IV family protein n=1 Tax=Pseudomonas lopnurensis TaxID=1477517 RepID=UPI0028ACED6A|nr:cytochrome C oxidase subunit IV family protein [Pseudomonas lopnurensis]
MSASKVLVACWLGLVALSACTVLLGNAGATQVLATGVLLAAFGKAWLITDGFMELRHAPRAWRLLLLGWPLVMAIGMLLTLL